VVDRAAWHVRLVGYPQIQFAGRASAASAVHCPGRIFIAAGGQFGPRSPAFLFDQGDVAAGTRGLLGIEAGRVLATQFGYTGSTLLLLAVMAAGWSVFSGMSWLWAFEQLGVLLERGLSFFYGR
jgi:hypothetical protein